MNAFPGERTDLMSPRECEDGASVIGRGPANFRNRRPSRRTETNAGTGEFDTNQSSLPPNRKDLLNETAGEFPLPQFFFGGRYSDGLFFSRRSLSSKTLGDDAEKARESSVTNTDFTFDPNGVSTIW